MSGTKSIGKPRMESSKKRRNKPLLTPCTPVALVVVGVHPSVNVFCKSAAKLFLVTVFIFIPAAAAAAAAAAASLEGFRIRGGGGGGTNSGKHMALTNLNSLLTALAVVDRGRGP